MWHVLTSWWFFAGLMVTLYLVKRVLMWRLTGRFGIRATDENLALSNHLSQAMLGLEPLVAKNEFGQAMHLLDEILKHPDLDKVPAVAANAHTNRVRVAAAVGRLDVALVSAEAATAAYRQLYQGRRMVPNAAALGEQLSFLGQVQRQLGQHEAARQTFEEVLKVNRHAAFRQTAIRAQIELARLDLAASSYDDAREHALHAQRLCAKWRLSDLQLEALDVETDIAMARGDRVEARRLLTMASAMLSPDAGPLPRSWLLATRADLEGQDGNAHEELLALFELLRNLCDLKVGRGWRQNQADIVAQMQTVEARLFAAGFARSLAGDEDAVQLLADALGMIRESEIANALRFGILENGAADPGLPQVISSLLGELERLEDPESGKARYDAATYERLEAATSARFRQLVELPSRRAASPSSPGNHFVQLRLVEDDDEHIVYGSWQNPSLLTSVFTHRLTPDEFEQLATITGRAEKGTSPAPAAKVRASASSWSGTSQYAALCAAEADWHALLGCLLPPELLDVLRSVVPGAPDSDVPLLLLATDGWLWTLPWAALRMSDDTTLIDHAAIALVPSYSLLTQSVAQPAGAGVLAYLRGVDPDGLEIERNALRANWNGRVREAATPAELTTALADADSYAAVTMSVHGDDRTGLAHSLILDPAAGTRLSAARMMACRFPRTVIVGACFSGDLDKRLGTDPTGIPTVMLCRGADTVIGGVFPLADGPARDHSTARIIGELYEHLATGIPAPWALRQALRWWKTTHNSPAATWAGLTAISNGARAER